MDKKIPEIILKNKLTSIVERLVKKLPGLVAVYLHGSAAKGMIRSDSDMDLALLFEYGEKPDAKAIFHLRPDLEGIAGRSVDIAILSTENPVFAKEVVANGVKIFCNDEGFCEEFEMYIFSFYAKLNDERMTVLGAYSTQ